MIYFTSDLHIGHNKDFVYAVRGCESIEQMEARIIINWNNIIKPEDTVYILGDLMLRDTEHGIWVVNQLNGKKVIIAGNHDTDTRLELYKEKIQNLEFIAYAHQIKYGKGIFYLSHYPTLTNNFDDQKAWAKHLINLFGHTHQTEKFYNDNPYMYNVGMDAHGLTPVSIDQIIEDIKKKKEELNNAKMSIRDE